MFSYQKIIRTLACHYRHRGTIAIQHEENITSDSSIDKTLSFGYLLHRAKVPMRIGTNLVVPSGCVVGKIPPTEKGTKTKDAAKEIRVKPECKVNNPKARHFVQRRNEKRGKEKSLGHRG